MMKKLTSLLLSVVMLVSLLACGASAKTLSAKTLRIAGLKGPTTMGLVHLLSMEKNGTAAMDYDLQLYGAADEIVPKLIKGNLDMAAIPANLAATLYQKTNGGIQVLAVNTLGVLYVVEKGDTVHSFADLKGRTILSTGKGTTPEYVLRYLLTKNGLDPDKDVKIEYYSEASEVTAQMAATKKDAIAVLPQPYVTAAQMKDSELRVVLDLTKEWNKVCDTQLITGVTVVRTAYAEDHPDVVQAFLKDYEKSVNAANTDIDGTAALCEEIGVVAKAAIAKKALPKCNIVYRRGEAEMPARLEEQHHAKEEGIEFLTLTNPTEILGGEDGRVCGMKCIKMELGEPDASGRRRPIPIEGSEFVLDVDMVIMSLGTSPNPLIRSTTPGLETNKKGGIIVDENEMSTRENVFAGGDAVTGAATVILAMGAGKKAAEAIDRKLQGK